MSQLGRLLGKFRSLRRRERRSCAKQDLGAETQRVYNEILDTVTANTANTNTSNSSSNNNSSSSLKSILRKREAPSPSVRSPSVTPSPSLAPSVASTSRIRSGHLGICLSWYKRYF